MIGMAAEVRRQPEPLLTGGARTGGSSQEWGTGFACQQVALDYQDLKGQPCPSPTGEGV